MIGWKQIVINESNMKDKNIIGVISDTHGLLRPEVKDIFNNAGLIIHAGDIGGMDIIKELEEIAPVIAVRGNIDTGEELEKLPGIQKLKMKKHNFTVIHNISNLKEGFIRESNIIIFGHSHKPLIEKKDETIFFNPGSAGKKRFSLPVSVGLLYLVKDKIKPEIYYFDV